MTEQRSSISARFAAQQRGRPRELPNGDEQRTGIEKIKSDIIPFIAALNADRPIPPDAAAYEISDTGFYPPLFPVQLKDIEEEGLFGFQIIGQSSMIEIVCGNEEGATEIEFTFSMTQTPKQDISADDAQIITMRRRSTFWPEEIIHGKYFDENRNGHFTFQSAFLHLILAESSSAQNNQYFFPGYGKPQAIFRLMPDNLKPAKDSPEGYARPWDIDSIDEGRLTAPLYKMETLRREANAPKETVSAGL